MSHRCCSIDSGRDGSPADTSRCAAPRQGATPVRRHVRHRIREKLRQDGAETRPPRSAILAWRARGQIARGGRHGIFFERPRIRRRGDDRTDCRRDAGRRGKLRLRQGARRPTRRRSAPAGRCPTSIPQMATLYGVRMQIPMLMGARGAAQDEQRAWLAAAPRLRRRRGLPRAELPAADRRTQPDDRRGDAGLLQAHRHLRLSRLRDAS